MDPDGARLKADLGETGERLLRGDGRILSLLIPQQRVVNLTFGKNSALNLKCI